METLILLALIASNLFMISRFVRKPAPPPPKGNANDPPFGKNNASRDSATDEGLAGRSYVDLERLNAIIDERIKESEDRMREEFTSREEVEVEDEPNPKTDMAIPQEKLDEVFVHSTVSEAFAEEPEVHEEVSGGHDFKALESATRVAKGLPHTPEEAIAARDTLKDMQGTAFEERISLDPKVRKRILTIIYGEASEQPGTAKTPAYSKAIDTREVDEINLNILT